MEHAPVQGMAVAPAHKHMKQVARRSWLAFLLAVLQLGAAISVICITRYNLESIYIATTGGPTGAWLYVCYLGTDLSSWACQYAYSLGAISIMLSMAVFVMQCVGWDETLTRAPRLVESGLDAFGFVWWLVGAIVYSVEINKFNQLAVSQPRQPSRLGVLALCWISTGLFLMLFVVNLTIAKKIHNVVHGHESKPLQQDKEAPQANAV